MTVPGGAAFTTFRLIAGDVAEPTQVTLTGTLGSSSASAVFTVHPPALKRLSFCCETTPSDVEKEAKEQKERQKTGQAQPSG